jgi:hypothetical protein
LRQKIGVKEKFLCIFKTSNTPKRTPKPTLIQHTTHNNTLLNNALKNITKISLSCIFFHQKISTFKTSNTPKRSPKPTLIQHTTHNKTLQTTRFQTTQKTLLQTLTPTSEFQTHQKVTKRKQKRLPYTHTRVRPLHKNKL